MSNIGVPVKQPPRSCDDAHCPFHGTLPVRGRILDGIVVSTHMRGTIVVRRDYHHYVPKYSRYERRHRRIMAHNPPCIEVQVHDTVRIMECRPLSKSVTFVVIEKVEAS
jgi:small subunit ribosomal protein S17